MERNRTERTFWVFVNVSKFYIMNVWIIHDKQMILYGIVRWLQSMERPAESQAPKSARRLVCSLKGFRFEPMSPSKSNGSVCEFVSVCRCVCVYG